MIRRYLLEIPWIKQRVAKRTRFSEYTFNQELIYKMNIIKNTMSHQFPSDVEKIA